MMYAWSENVWQACWQGGLVVLAVWAILRLLPSMPARCQCWFWRLAMLKFVVVLLLPSMINLPLLPAPAVFTHVVAQPHVVTTAPMRQADNVQVSAAQTAQWPSLPTVLWYAWLTGMGCSFLRILLGRYAVRQLKRRSQTISDGPITEQLRMQARLFGLCAAPRLLEVPGSGSPMLLGAFWPVIVIPAETCRRLNAAEQTMVLGHELAHIRRGDLVWGLMGSPIRAVFFFHPLVWLCERQLKLAQEIAADQLAILKQNHDPIGYASLLVSVVGKLGSKMGSRPLISTLSLETAGPIHSLTRRLVAMSRIGRTSRRMLVCSGVLLGSLVLLGIVPWRLVAAEPKNEQPKHFYVVKICTTEHEKGKPDRQLRVPTYCLYDGQRFFAQIDQSDKRQVLLVTVVASPNAEQAVHAIQVHGLRDPSGKELSEKDVHRLIDEESKYFGQIQFRHRPFNLPKGECFAVAHGLGGNSDDETRSWTSAVTFKCDQEAKVADVRSGSAHRDYLFWQSDCLQVSNGATSTIRIARLRGNEAPQVEIKVTITPTERPTEVAAEREAGDQAPSQHVGNDKITETMKNQLVGGCKPTGTHGPLALAVPFHVASRSYEIDVLENGTRIVAFNKRTAESKSLDLPENASVTDLFVGDDIAAGVMGAPHPQAILFNNRIGKWLTFRLPTCDPPLDPRPLVPIVGDHVVCYPLRDRIVAYSAIRDTWGVLVTNAFPAVGDYAVKAETATEKSEFTAQSGTWVTVKAPAARRR